MRVSIEQMRLSDLEEVLRIERQSFPTPWRPETYRREILHNPGAYYVVARLHALEGPRVVGYAGMWVIADEGHITTIAVDPPCRGLKIGERLLVDLLEWGIRHAVVCFTLEVREANLVAQRLYRKYGFDAVGMRRGYYSDTGENAILMWVENAHAPTFQRLLRENKRHLEERERAATGP